MDSSLTKEEILSYLKQYFSILEANFTLKVKKKIPYNEIFEMCQEISTMMANLYNKDFEIAGKICDKHFIPLLELLTKIDPNSHNIIEYRTLLKEAYRMSARTNLESYFIYRDFDSEEPFYAPRYEILRGYIHFLQEIVTNPKFRLLIFNAPSGAGKTYPEKISEAWAYGVNPTGTTLALCSNDDVVKGGSRVVIDEIKSEEFGEVFPNLKYTEDNKNFFLKETDGQWKLKDCNLLASYYAKTVQSNVVGSRASMRIHIDDLYADYLEAMNQNLNEYYINKYLTVWSQRFVQNKIPKVVVTGTLWASGDFIALLIQMIEKKNTLYQSEKYKYCRTNKEETIAVIQVPALDENGQSTYPDVKPTEEILDIKENMDEYLFETNFQQKPTDPEALFFSWNKLRTYDKIPATDYIGCYATIDATRKSGKDFFAMPIFVKVPNENEFDYYLKDCLFTRTATKDMYQDVVDMIIKHHIIELVIESNVTSELKQNVEKILAKMGISYCTIHEKYNIENKALRIETEKGIVLRKIIFPAKGVFGQKSQMGLMMNNITLYNVTGRNQNDDGIDSVCMFASEIIEGGSKGASVKPMKRLF